MKSLTRITTDHAIVDGKPCIRGMQVTVSNVLNLLATGHSRSDILKAFPLLEPEDLDEALAYAARQIDGAEKGNANALLMRRAGLHAGAIIVRDDFDAPLPEELWIGSP